MKKLLVLSLLLSIFIMSCGSDTSGSLSVAAPTVSNGVVTAIAKYTPASGSALSGQSINFRWYTVGVTSKSKSAEIATSGHTDNSGSVNSQFTLPVNRTESIIVYVIATTGDLTNIEGWQSVQVDP